MWMSDSSRYLADKSNAALNSDTMLLSVSETILRVWRQSQFSHDHNLSSLFFEHPVTANFQNCSSGL